MRVLVTGENGFVGSSIFRQKKDGHLQCDYISSSNMDITSFDSIEQVIQKVDFDAVLHLAALSNVAASFENPKRYYDVNLGGTVNLIEALKKSKFAGRLVFVSSGDVYGQVDHDILPISETASVNPSNPYAASKLAAEQYCLMQRSRLSFEVMIARPFNHIGPGQRLDFVVSRFAKCIADMSRGISPAALTVGDLSATRDFLDVRDVLDAYESLLLKGASGLIYNISSGSEVQISEILNRLIALVELDIEIITDKNLLRPSTNSRLAGDNSLIKEVTGWHPKYSLDETLTEIFLSHGGIVN